MNAGNFHPRLEWIAIDFSPTDFTWRYFLWLFLTPKYSSLETLSHTQQTNVQNMHCENYNSGFDFVCLDLVVLYRWVLSNVNETERLHSLSEDPELRGVMSVYPRSWRKREMTWRNKEVYRIVGVFLVLYLWVDSKKLNNIHCLLTHSKGDLLICDHFLKFLMNKRVESEIEGKKEISDHCTNRDFLQVQELMSWYPLDSSTDWQSDQGEAM